MTGRSPSGRPARPAAQAPAGLGDTATIPNAAADRLDEARALIEAGWVQGVFCEGGRYCAGGALIRAFANESDYGIRRAAFGALERTIGVSKAYQIWAWNDAERRTQAEVVEAFRKAAELARGQVQS